MSSKKTKAASRDRLLDDPTIGDGLGGLDDLDVGSGGFGGNADMFGGNLNGDVFGTTLNEGNFGGNADFGGNLNSGNQNAFGDTNDDFDMNSLNTFGSSNSNNSNFSSSKSMKKKKNKGLSSASLGDDFGSDDFAGGPGLGGLGGGFGDDSGGFGGGLGGGFGNDSFGLDGGNLGGDFDFSGGMDDGVNDLFGGGFGSSNKTSNWNSSSSKNNSLNNSLNNPLNNSLSGSLTLDQRLNFASNAMPGDAALGNVLNSNTTEGVHSANSKKSTTNINNSSTSTALVPSPTSKNPKSAASTSEISESDLLIQSVNTNIANFNNGTGLAGTSNIPAAALPLEEDCAVRPPDVVAAIQNLACSFQLKTEIDLKDLCCKCRNAEYNPKKLNSVIIRQKKPKGTALVYAGGRVTLTGCSSLEDAKLCGKKVAKTIQQCGYVGVKFANFKVENLVAMTDLKFPLRLEGVAFHHREYAQYEPELFPGLVWRICQPFTISLLCFVSGKIILTGGKTMEHVNYALDLIYPLMYKFQK